MIRRPPRSTLSSSSAASDVYKRQLPIRVGERRRLRDEVVFRRLLIHRGRADEDVLLDSTPKERHVALDVVRGIGDPVDDDVELKISQGGANVARAAYVCGHHVTAGQMR